MYKLFYIFDNAHRQFQCEFEFEFELIEYLEKIQKSQNWDLEKMRHKYRVYKNRRIILIKDLLREVL